MLSDTLDISGAYISCSHATSAKPPKRASVTIKDEYVLHNGVHNKYVDLDAIKPLVRCALNELTKRRRDTLRTACAALVTTTMTTTTANRTSYGTGKVNQGEAGAWRP